MAFIQVPENREGEMLRKFYEDSVFTFEGLDISEKKTMKEMEKFFKKNGFPKNQDFIAYWFKGSVMNEHYNLTGDNRYQDDITFVVVPNYYNPLVKIGCGARWFDDIVDNNAYRESGLHTGLENYE